MSAKQNTTLKSTFGWALKAISAMMVLIVAGSFAASAQERVKVEAGDFAYDFRIYFPFDDARFSPNYLENPETLAKLDSVIAVHGLDAIDHLVVIAKSSPEGPYKYNMNLSARRAASMRDYLLGRFPGLDGKIELENGVSPWPESRKKEDLVRLRYAAFRLVFPYDINRLPEITLDETPYQLDLPAPELAISQEPLSVVIPDDKYKQMIFALKTNLLYDAVTALNVELEVPIGRRFSLMWEDVFPWWETGNKYCFQYWEMGAEARYWFKPWDVNGVEKLRGFFVGPYVMSAKYDFQNDRKFNYQGEHWSAGIAAGWATPIGKKKRVNLEFEIAAGFLSTQNRGYVPADDYSLLIRNPYDKPNTISPFVPTKSKISLVVPIYITRTRGGSAK